MLVVANPRMPFRAVGPSGCTWLIVSRSRRIVNGLARNCFAPIWRRVATSRLSNEWAADVMTTGAVRVAGFLRTRRKKSTPPIFGSWVSRMIRSGERAEIAYSASCRSRVICVS